MPAAAFARPPLTNSGVGRSAGSAAALARALAGILLAACVRAAFLADALAGAGPVTLREAARRVGRDVRAVHSDVHMLLQAGVLRKDGEGRIEFPFSGVFVDFMLKTAA